MTSTVYIAKNVYGGDGLGRLGDGRVIFVPGAFAGEQVKAEIVAEKRHWVRARLVDVVDPSPERISTAPMPAPGMVYANMSRKGEIAAKSEQLKEALRKVLPEGKKVAFLDDANAAMLNYRNKATYHFAKSGKSWSIGYMVERTHEVVDVTSDPLVRPEINTALPEIRRKTLMLLTQGPASVRETIARKGSLTVRWSKASGVNWWIGDAPKDLVIKEMVCGKTFEVPADGFWQMNPVVGELLVKETVAEYERAKESAPDFIDLYCGVGVFGLCANPRRLTGVESGRRAVEFAKKNAAALGQPDARFFAEETGRALRRLRFTDRTTVVLDPPRGGLERGVATYLSRSRAKRIIYVSCDPMTLARDLADLLRGYTIKSVKWLDMFPRTSRFETIVTLEHK